MTYIKFILKIILTFNLILVVVILTHLPFWAIHKVHQIEYHSFKVKMNPESGYHSFFLNHTIVYLGYGYHID
jgi:hypothetical protein